MSTRDKLTATTAGITFPIVLGANVVFAFLLWL